jgi:hypothetical protein
MAVDDVEGSDTMITVVSAARRSTRTLTDGSKRMESINGRRLEPAIVIVCVMMTGHRDEESRDSSINVSMSPIANSVALVT